MLDLLAPDELPQVPLHVLSLKDELGLHLENSVELDYVRVVQISTLRNLTQNRGRKSVVQTAIASRHVNCAH